MKRRFTVSAAAAAIVIAAIAAFSQERPVENPKDVKLFMRAKLVHSQKVLEGLTLENFDAVSKHAQQMALMSQDASWDVLQTQEYYERSADFRRSIGELKNAADKKNLDGAALAYMGVTLKCIECHRYLRQVQHVETEAN
jgi:cytochrome c556